MWKKLLIPVVKWILPYILEELEKAKPKRKAKPKENG